MRRSWSTIDQHGCGIVELNVGTGHVATLSADRIHHFDHEPQRHSRGLKDALLELRVQRVLQGPLSITSRCPASRHSGRGARRHRQAPDAGFASHLSAMPTPSSVALERIEAKILLIRGQKVMLDADLAELYGVTTKRLNEQVRRNLERFPGDFMFRLTSQEVSILRSQFATSSSETWRSAWGGRRSAPYAFTEHGAIMVATVLNSPRAIEVSVYVVRAFVRLREMIATNKELAKKLEDLERRLDTHDEAIVGILQAIRELMRPAEPSKKRRIGFT
jgi:hypothetical protein